MKSINIIGTGGLAKELISYIESESEKRYCIAGCWADEPFNNDRFAGYYKGDIEKFKKEYRSEDSVIISIANNKYRARLVREIFSDLEVQYETYIHPSCEVSPFAEIGAGCLLAPQVIICADAIIGEHTFMNTECVIGHDSVVSSFCCLFPKVEVCGDCTVESFCTFGIGSIILPGNRMKEGSKLDAMSVLRSSIEDPAMFVGNPAKPVKIYK